MLVIYKAIQGGLVLPGSEERAEKIIFSEIEPQINDVVSMGELRLWEVTKIERYGSSDDSAFLAIVIPKGIPVPAEADWSGIYWPEYPNRTFAVAVQQNGAILTYEAHMDGIPMSGRIEQSMMINGKPQLIASDWVVQTVITYTAIVPSAYAAIYCCECSYSPQAIAV